MSVGQQTSLEGFTKSRNRINARITCNSTA